MKTHEEHIAELISCCIRMAGEIEKLEKRVAALEDKQARSKSFNKPTETEVMNYAIIKGLTAFDAKALAEKFCAFYESKGWMIGKNKMKNWEMAATTWLKSGNYTTILQKVEPKSKWL